MNNTYKRLCNDPDYDLVSFCNRSIPTPGSECRAKQGIDPNYPIIVEKVINHRSGDITIKTRVNGYIKFWKVCK